MTTAQNLPAHQYIDRNGNVRTIALRHRVKGIAALEARAAANVVPTPTLEERRAQAIADLKAERI